MLKKIGIVVVLCVLVVLTLAATKPDTFALARETTINAPPAKVFALINDFHQWGAWSPWDKLDPNMTRTFSGTPGGVGSIYEWSGNSDAGAGIMQIITATPSFVVEIQLDFTKPFASHNITEFALDSTAAGTHVVKRSSEYLMTSTLPNLSDSFPANTLTSRDAKVKSIKNVPLLAIPKCRLQSDITVKTAP